MAKRRKAPIEIATRDEAAAFIGRLQQRFPETPLTPEEKEELRVYLAGFDTERLRSVMRSALITMVQHQAEAPLAPSRRKRKKS